MADLTGARLVWLASYLKSGNTWLRAVLTAHRTGAAPDLGRLDGGPIAADRHTFDTVLGVPSSDLTADEIDALRPRADEALAAGGTGLHVRKVHDALFPGPAGEPVVSVAATAGAVYVVRDPRDIAVSLADQRHQPLAWAVDRLCDPRATLGAGWVDEQFRQRVGTWSDHVVSWVDQAWFPVHVIRYEDCCSHPVATFGAALRFAGLAATDDEVAAAVEHASFCRLQAREQAGGFPESAGSPFFRHGRAGDWRAAMGPELARRLEETHRPVMARFGYVDPAL